METTGTVFDVQTFCIHDGPGIRTTVFLKGCPLRCLWCHNPESLSRKRELLFDVGRCRSCATCVDVCPNDAHQIVDGEHNLGRELCSVCGVCADVCCAEALEIVGREVTVDEVMATVLKDVPFYNSSDGGMTLSGGEPLAQPKFALALLQAANGQGVHCCVETSGFGDWQSLESMLSSTDLFLFDIKETDPHKHKQFTGVPLDPILDNLRKLCASGANLRLRLPLIPGCNARSDHFETVGHLIKEMPRLQGVEIMPYHRLGEGKRERLGRGGLEHGIVVPSEDTVASWAAQLGACGVDVIER